VVFGSILGVVLGFDDGAVGEDLGAEVEDAAMGRRRSCWRGGGVGWWVHGW